MCRGECPELIAHPNVFSKANDLQAVRWQVADIFDMFLRLQMLLQRFWV